MASNPKPPDPTRVKPRSRNRRLPPPPKPQTGQPKSCPIELVTTVPIVIISLLARAAWRRVVR